MNKRLHLLYLGFSAVILAVTSVLVFAGEHEVFDGRNYNGKFYPRIDIIEWNEENLPSHMEFQNYHFAKEPVDMAFELEEKDGRKVMMVKYTLKSRGEELCRRVVAPGHFKGDFMVYKETEKDREITYVSIVPLPDKKGRKLISNGNYAGCSMPKPERMPASQKNEQKNDNDYDNGLDPDVDSQKRDPGSAGALKGKGAAVPFSDW